MKTKVCTKCDKRLRLNKFSKCNDGLQAWCRDCQKEYSRRRYRELRDQYINKQHKNEDRKLELARRYIKGYKSRPCADCQAQYPHYIMELDYEQNTHRGNMHRFARRASTDSLISAVKVCDVVCANCNRKRMFKANIIDP